MSAVLVNHGPFNPVHYGHLDAMSVAARRLENDGYVVTTAFLSIAPVGRYVPAGGIVLNSDHRFNLLELFLAKAGVNWIHADRRGINCNSGAHAINDLFKT